MKKGTFGYGGEKETKSAPAEKRTLWLPLSAAVLFDIFAAVLAGCVAFFRVNQVIVNGNSRYTAEEIVEASSVHTGDNLFLVNKPKTARALMRKLPYVENVSVVRRLPDTLELRVTESAAVRPSRLRGAGGWWMPEAAAGQGDASLQGTLPQILGLTPIAPGLGSRIAVDQETEEAPLKLESLRTCCCVSIQGYGGKPDGVY